MSISNNDKESEWKRYDLRAQNILRNGFSFEPERILGATAYLPALRGPYNYFAQCISHNVFCGHDLLELGSGSGIHTQELVNTGARVVASDISSHSLELLSSRIPGVKTVVADIESLPFEKNSFDIVTSAGSLSYGDPVLVDKEILRVLKPGGTFICVDSLNHNPIYRLNRWLQYKCGKRTKSTLLYMPDMKRIQSLSKGFRSVKIKYFGAVSYLMPMLAIIIGQSKAAQISDAVDQLFNIRRSAFKFVMVANGRI